jgi:hypothetical protein
MPIRAQAVGSRVSPHLALGRSRDGGSTGSRRRRQALQGRAMRPMSRERYRAYGEDEFFAAVADEHQPPLVASPSGIEAPGRHRIASVAVLVGVVGAVAGVVAIDVLSQRGSARRTAPLRVARTGVGPATPAALRRSRLQPARASRAPSSAGRQRIALAPRARRPKPQHGRRNGGARARVDQVNATVAPMRLRGDSRHGHAVAAADAPLDTTTSRPADEQGVRVTVASAADDVPRRPRVEFGFER